MKRSHAALVVLGVGLLLGACSSKGTDPVPDKRTPEFEATWPVMSSEEDTCLNVQPRSIACDGSGNLFILDAAGTVGQMVYQHRADGTWVRTFGGFEYPTAMTAWGGSLCILDSKQVVEYSMEGTHLRSKDHYIPLSCWYNNWSKGIAEGYHSYDWCCVGQSHTARLRWTMFSVNCTAPETVSEWDTLSETPWEVRRVPRDTVHTISEAHFLMCSYMSDVYLHSRNGWFLQDLYDAEHYPDHVALPLPSGLGAIAVGPKAMIQVQGVAVTGWPVYVVNGDEILKYTVAWTPWRYAPHFEPHDAFYGMADPDWLGTGTEDGPLDDPKALACDSLGSLFVLDGCTYGGTPRIQKFSPDGTLITKFDPCGHVEVEEGGYESPIGMTIGPGGEIYVLAQYALGKANVLMFK